jgi:hypothetical protein
MGGLSTAHAVFYGDGKAFKNGSDGQSQAAGKMLTLLLHLDIDDDENNQRGDRSPKIPRHVKPPL